MVSGYTPQSRPIPFLLVAGSVPGQGPSLALWGQVWPAVSCQCFPASVSFQSADLLPRSKVQGGMDGVLPGKRYRTRALCLGWCHERLEPWGGQSAGVPAAGRMPGETTSHNTKPFSLNQEVLGNLERHECLRD